MSTPRRPQLVVTGRSGSDATLHDGQQSVDSVEKVGPPKLPAHRLVKTPFLHAAT
ncbi:hypothetical protein D9M71_387560 [compost metagenome]